jgi:hypothetical protein
VCFSVLKRLLLFSPRPLLFAECRRCCCMRCCIAIKCGSAYGKRHEVSIVVRRRSPCAQFLAFCSLRIAVFRFVSSALLHGLLHRAFLFLNRLASEGITLLVVFAGVRRCLSCASRAVLLFVTDNLERGLICYYVEELLHLGNIQIIVQSLIWGHSP